jgi:2-iminoacetate synthase ThiH
MDETRSSVLERPNSFDLRFATLQGRRDGSGRKVLRNAGAAQYMRVLAASRLYLDNIDHVQASWFSEGKGREGGIALRGR